MTTYKQTISTVQNNNNDNNNCIVFFCSLSIYYKFLVLRVFPPLFFTYLYNTSLGRLLSNETVCDIAHKIKVNYVLIFNLFFMYTMKKDSNNCAEYVRSARTNVKQNLLNILLCVTIDIFQNIFERLGLNMGTRYFGNNIRIVRNNNN